MRLNIIMRKEKVRKICAQKKDCYNNNEIKY